MNHMKTHCIKNPIFIPNIYELKDRNYHIALDYQRINRSCIIFLGHNGRFVNLFDSIYQ